QRGTSPLGSNSIRQPTPANTMAGSDGIGGRQRPGVQDTKNSSIHCSNSDNRSASSRASPPPGRCSASSNAPQRESGTTSRLTSGIANRLATGAFSDVCPVQIISGSNSPTLTAHCGCIQRCQLYSHQCCAA